MLLTALFGAVQASAAAKVHEGFQLRGALGGGYLADTMTRVPLDSLDIQGAAGVLEVYLGGSLLPGFTIGGSLSETMAFGPTVGSESASSNSMTLFGIGPYMDYYPTPSGWFHVLGTLGFALVTRHIDVEHIESPAEPSLGFGIGAGVGYDFWVGDGWSLGVLGRLTFASMQHDEHLYAFPKPDQWTFKDTAVAPSLLLSVSVH